jgi:hypothetical protein
MRNFALFFLFVFQVSISNNHLFAQYFNPRVRYTSIGFSIKASYFDGDIKTPIQLIRPGIGIHINRRITPRITLTSELSWVRLMGDDNTGNNLQNPAKIPYYIRNLHFRNDIKQWMVGVKYDLFPSTDHYRKRPVYNIYLGVGMSFLLHNPKARFFIDSTFSKTKWTSLRPLETENHKYSSWTIGVPVSIGVRYKLSLQWDMEVELSYQYNLTDYLDDVSGNYPDPNSLTSPKAKALSNRSADPYSAISGNKRDLDYIQNQLGHSLIQSSGYSYVQGNGPGDSRGSKKGNDGFALLSVRFIYAIPGRINCPKFREFQ